MVSGRLGKAGNGGRVRCRPTSDAARDRATVPGPSNFEAITTRPLLAASLPIAGLAAARARTGDMSCADYPKTDAQDRRPRPTPKADAQAQDSLGPADRAMIAADSHASALDAEMRADCRADPKASSSEAMTTAMQSVRPAKLPTRGRCPSGENGAAGVL